MSIFASSDLLFVLFMIFLDIAGPYWRNVYTIFILLSNFGQYLYDKLKNSKLEEMEISIVRSSWLNVKVWTSQKFCSDDWKE